MAVENKLQKATGSKNKSEQIAEYEANGMKVTLTPNVVRNYLVSGNKDRVTFEEVSMFINLCKFSGLNPWLKEAYCIKYGDEPAAMVVGKEAFLKRADNNPFYDGLEAGIIVFDDSTGEITYRKGTLTLPGEKIIGGYAEVWRKDKGHSYRSEVSFDECAVKKKDGTLNPQWYKKPATMIRKVALVQALKEAFPNSYGGMYTAEEQGVTETEYSPAEIIDPQEQPTEPDEAPAPVEAPDASAALFGK